MFWVKAKQPKLPYTSEDYVTKLIFALMTV